MMAAICLLSCKSNTSDMSTIYDFKALSNKGKEVNFADYKGKVLLIVNTASKCGFTPQYDGLEALYQKYKDQGLVVIGFPCDQFGHQEPGNDEQIEEFCRINHGVTFPLMSKIEVNGENEHPIYKWLKSQAGFAGFDPEHKLTKVLDEMFTKADKDYASKPDIKWKMTIRNIPKCIIFAIEKNHSQMKLLDFAKHFDSEEACEKYLKETREKEGIKCSRC
ncbi:MAG: glutathione peroxidase, partial [Bacteroidaceae bacterium]|nr:glutathione peroxidase [Bacteroidaceae bacterium]